jgi:hypothetical protein
MHDALEAWFWLSWVVAVGCLLASIFLRAWLVHILMTRHPTLYVQLGSPAFFASWLPGSRHALIRSLAAVPFGTLADSETRVVRYVRMLYVIGQISCLSIVAVVAAQALLPT